MSLFERISEQLQLIEYRLGGLRRELHHAKPSPISVETSLAEVDVSTKELNRFIGHLHLFSDILTQLDNGATLDEATAQALQSIWQKIPLSYAVIILGEAELGPYHYHGMQGIEEPGQYLGRECPFPLSGVLAQTLLHKLDPTVSDYLCIDDIRAQQRPTGDEFPWLPMHGSMLILPLRLNSRSVAKGVLIIGRSVQGGFADSELRQELADIAKNLAQLIHHAQMRHELTKHTEQLVNVHLVTREIARARSVYDVLYLLTKKIAEIINDVDVEIYLRSLETIYDPLIDPNEPGLYLYESSGYVYKPLSVQIEQLFAWTMRVGEPIFYQPSRLYSEPEHPFYSISGPALVVPIVGKEYTFGVIQVIARDDAHHLDETDTLVMRSIANSVAVALKNLDMELGKAQAVNSSLHTLISVAEEQTGTFAGHSQRVAHNVSLMVRRLGLDDKTWAQIRAAAALHDVHVLIHPRSDNAEGDLQNDYQHQVALSGSLLRQMDVHSPIIHLVEQMARPYGANEVISSLLINASDDEGKGSDDPASQGTGSGDQDNPLRAAPTPTSHRNLSHSKHTPALENASALGAQIICLADRFDTWLCTTLRRQADSIEAQLQYLDSQAGLALEPELVALFQNLLRENQLLLPSRSSKRAERQRI